MRAFLSDIAAVMKVKSYQYTLWGFTAVTFAAGAAIYDSCLVETRFILTLECTGSLAQWAPTFVTRQSQVCSPK